MSLCYTKKTQPALWTTVANATPVRGPAKREPKRFIRSISTHRQFTSREYAKEARAFVAAAVDRGERCPVFAAFDRLPPEVQKFLTFALAGSRKPDNLSKVHHSRGRAGALLMDKRHWLAVSKWGHRAIGAFPIVAREFGWLCAVGQWNSPETSTKQGEESSK